MALFTFDKAAPVELTAAPFHHLHVVRVEATAAAKQLTAVNRLGGLVALPPTRAQDPVSEVMVTEVRAGVQVHQIFISVWFELGIFGNKHFGGANLPLLNLRGPVKFLL